MSSGTTGLDGLRWLVTGGASGIGLATAELATARGAVVTLADRDVEAAERAAAGLGAGGATTYAVACDVGDPAAIASAVAGAAELMGGIDVLHCNAGVTDAIVADDTSVDGLTAAEWDRVYAVNVRGIFLCVQAALPHLRRSAAPAVVTAASIAAGHARPRTLAYASSKAAVVMLTKSLALELAPDGVRVNGYSPGMIRTDMAERYLAASADPEALLGRVLENYLTPDIGAPADVAEVACFLGSPAARFVTGTVVEVDGGFGAFKATLEERNT